MPPRHSIADHHFSGGLNDAEVALHEAGHGHGSVSDFAGTKEQHCLVARGPTAHASHFLIEVLGASAHLSNRHGLIGAAFEALADIKACDGEDQSVVSIPFGP